MPLEPQNKITHPSFGMIQICRSSSSQSMNLFGCSIKQRNFIRIEIRKACLYRELNQDNIFPEGIPIVSIDMSPSQFADAITSLNTSGTPCTITFMEGHEVKGTSLESKRVQFDAEFEEKMREVVSDTNPYYTKINEIVNKSSLGKHDRAEILKQLNLLKQEIAANIPFIKEQFTEQMDETVVEAKNEITAFIEERLIKLGLEGFKKQLTLEYKELG